MMIEQRNTMSKPCCKKVGFSRQVRVVLCPSVFDYYTPAEIKACWYNDEERERIRRKAGKAIKLMMTAPSQQADTDICTRGLEYQTRDGALSRQCNRRAAYFAVMQEQECQIEENVLDEYAIAMAYAKQTASSKAQAYMMGLADQFESRSIHQSGTIHSSNKNKSSSSCGKGDCCYSAPTREHHPSFSRQRRLSPSATAA